MLNMIKEKMDAKSFTKDKIVHTPIDFVDQYIAHTWNTGTLLSLTIGLFGFADFFKSRHSRHSSGDSYDAYTFGITVFGLLIFVYNVFYSMKSIRDFKEYLEYFEPIKDQYDPIYTIYLDNWKEWIYYQYSFVGLVIGIGLILTYWRVSTITFLN